MSVLAPAIQERLNVEPAALDEFCRRNGVLRLSIFGSALREDFRPHSDLDLLIEFLPGQRISLFDLGGMAADLTALLGRPVDLRTPEDLSRYFREEVLRLARPLYAA